jgi:hypothetical protein
MIYDYYHHIFGCLSDSDRRHFRGCHMSMGHYQKHKWTTNKSETVTPFFNPDQCRVFLQSGIARMGLSIPDNLLP